MHPKCAERVVHNEPMSSLRGAIRSLTQELAREYTGKRVFFPFLVRRGRGVTRNVVHGVADVGDGDGDDYIDYDVDDDGDDKEFLKAERSRS